MGKGSFFNVCQLEEQMCSFLSFFFRLFAFHSKGVFLTSHQNYLLIKMQVSAPHLFRLAKLDERRVNPKHLHFNRYLR